MEANDEAAAAKEVEGASPEELRCVGVTEKHQGVTYAPKCGPGSPCRRSVARSPPRPRAPSAPTRAKVEELKTSLANAGTLLELYKIVSTAGGVAKQSAAAIERQQVRSVPMRCAWVAPGSCGSACFFTAVAH
jgi:hypothetical protein